MLHKVAPAPGWPLAQLVLSAEAVVVSLDENYRPKRISKELLEAIRHGRPLAGVGLGAAGAGGATSGSPSRPAVK